MRPIAIPIRPDVHIPAGFRERVVRVSGKRVAITLPAVVRSPLVVNLGMGTDSSALLVMLAEAHHAGNPWAKPDLILFADTGSEKANTYAHLPVMNAWLASVGFPLVTVVAKADRGLSDASLHESCLRLGTMPSLAYGGKSCSLKWKVAELDHFLARWEPAQAANAVCLPIITAIGYDASPADLKRSGNMGDELQQFWYPLRDAGLTRAELVAIIDRAGLGQPGKSACFMCPAMKRAEVLDLLRTEPAKLALALRIEAGALARSAREGRDMSTVGLGRSWSWREYLEATCPGELAAVCAAHDTGADHWHTYQSLTAAPAA